MGAFSRFMCPKTKLFAVEFRRILEFSSCKVYRKSYGRIFTIYVSKNEVVSCEVQTHFGNFHLARFIEKFWAHYHEVCVWKRSCLPWSSGAFLKFIACKFCRKGSGRIFTIFASKNETLSWSWDAVWKFSLCEVYKKFWAHFHDLCVQKRSCFPWSLPLETASFVSSGKLHCVSCEACHRNYRVVIIIIVIIRQWQIALSRFLRPTPMLFTGKFRRILEVFSMQSLWKSSGRNFTINASKT